MYKYSRYEEIVSFWFLLIVIIKGLCVVCPSGSKSFIAYPSRIIGQVCLVDLAATEKPVVEIHAHEASIMCKYSQFK
jgi:hypothetical protein